MHDTPMNQGKHVHVQCSAFRVEMHGPAEGVGMGRGEVGILPVILLPYCALSLCVQLLIGAWCKMESLG